MTNNTLKNRVRFSTTIGKDTEKILREYSENTMVPISKIVDCAISEYVANQSKERQTSE